ncbi:hypothetical protein niasHS_016179 [Heterodera schachtii]|uniref:Lon proteolytic domain-containing protein n=1 Tax=Heterodera schachtii TaxID=97005 RepID=A0ABD2HWD6_HETSC
MAIGLSVGAAAFTAFFSLALNRCVRIDVAFSGYVFATREVLGVSRIIEKIVGMSDFGLRKVIVPTGNTAQIYAHEREHPEDFGNVTIMPCGSCLEIINAGIF